MRCLSMLPILYPLIASGRGALMSSLGPVVDLGYAAYAGNITSPAGKMGSVGFYGAIPYAQPPLGNLRWRAPQPINTSTQAKEVTDARDWGPACLQRPAVVGIGSEDCLTLNIWKPINASAGSHLPVAVYIHGGGFYYGTPQGFPLYNWVDQHPTGLIGVSITYRLGMLGFLGGSVVSSDGALNAGLLDQRAGLEWIQDHIAEFGGDPNQVTIYGESAGGASIVMQIAAYGGEKHLPFQRAVAQSIGFGPTNTEEVVEQTFVNATTYVGCPSSGPDSMPCMRKTSLGAIVSAINRTPNGLFAPIIDGPEGFLPDLPSRLIHQGRFGAVEFIGGHCSGDGKTFAGGTPDDFVTDDDIKRLVFSRWPSTTDALRDKALSLYPAPNVPGSPYATQWDRAWTMAGEVIYACMDTLLANRILSHNVENVYSYVWNAPDTVLYNEHPYLGAMHTSDLYYLFTGTNTFGNAGSTFTPFNTSETVLAAEAIAYWTSFAATGDPSSTKLSNSPTWNSLNGPERRQRMLLTRGDDEDSSTHSAMEVISPDELDRCQFWMSEEVVSQTRV